MRLLLFMPLLLLFAAPLDAQVRVDKTTWQGHDALKLSNGTVELVVTTGIGPRIIRYAFIGGENILAELAATPATTTALGDWKPWGGHRLWAAPESMPGSYGPDNGPVQAQVSGNRVTLTQPRDAAGLEKQMTVTLAETGTGVTIGHRLTNATPWTLDLSAWALTIMNGGGMVIIPNEPYKSHDEALLPTRAIATWAYTDLSDPRWTFGSKYIRLRTDAGLNAPQKIGVANRRWLGGLPPERHAVRQARGLGRHRRVSRLRRQHRDLHLRELHRARDAGTAPQGARGGRRGSRGAVVSVQGRERRHDRSRRSTPPSSRSWLRRSSRSPS